MCCRSEINARNVSLPQISRKSKSRLCVSSHRCLPQKPGPICWSVFILDWITMERRSMAVHLVGQELSIVKPPLERRKAVFQIVALLYDRVTPAENSLFKTDECSLKTV
jgi:hypothetical protein